MTKLTAKELNTMVVTNPCRKIAPEHVEAVKQRIHAEGMGAQFNVNDAEYAALAVQAAVKQMFVHLGKPGDTDIFSLLHNAAKENLVTLGQVAVLPDGQTFLRLSGSWQVL